MNIESIKKTLKRIGKGMSNSKKRKFVSLLLIVFLSYQIGFHLYNHEPVTNHTQNYIYSLDVYNSGEAEDGYTAFMIAGMRASILDMLFGGVRPRDMDASQLTQIVVIIDMDGNIVRSREMSYEGTDGSLIGGMSPVEVWNSTTISVASGAGFYLWNLKTNVEYQVPNVFGHHEIEYNPVNNTFFTLHYKNATIDDVNYMSDSLIEYDLDGTVVWEVDITQFIDIDWLCPYATEDNGLIDLTHSNTVDYDVDEDMVYVNVRNIDTVLAINHTNGELEWSVGRYGNFTMYDINGREIPKLFSHSHATRKIGPNKFITFDNDQHNLENSPFTGLPLGMTLNTVVQQSRLVEFELNFTTMTANETWVWVSPDSMHCPMWGDVSRLENGNTFGVFGVPHMFRHLGLITHKDAQLVEITPDGEVVWKATFRGTDGHVVGVYRATRLPYTTWDFL